jgi:hypothetical protein
MRLQRTRRVEMRRIDFDPTRRRRRARECAAAHIRDRFDRLACREPMRDFDDGALGVAVEQQVGACIEQDRPPYLLGPVVEVSDAPQARLDAAYHDRYVGVGLPRPLTVNDHAAVRASTGGSAGRVGVVAADASIGRVAVDHRVHVAGGNAEEQVRSTEPLEIVRTVPIRLGDDADAKTLRFE